MKTLAYFYAVVALLILDGIWIGFVAKAFYQKHLGYIMGPVKWWAVPVFYLVYSLAITVFITSHALNDGATLTKVFLLGALLGAAAYGAYDFTNQATLKDWPIAVTIVDLLWGAFMTGLVATIVVWLSRMGK